MSYAVCAEEFQTPGSSSGPIEPRLRSLLRSYVVLGSISAFMQELFMGISGPVTLPLQIGAFVSLIGEMLLGRWRRFHC